MVIIHHLAVDAVSWRIVLEDLNIAWAQHRGGQPVALPAGGTSFARWAALLGEYARPPRGGGARRCLEAGGGGAGGVAGGAPGGGHLCHRRAVCRCRWMPRPPGMLLGEVPAAFHAGVQDILLIAFALAVAQFLGNGSAPVGIDVEGHGRHEELGPDVDLSRTVGWFTTKYPVALTVGGLSWAQVVAGEAALGAVIKDAKEQLRALPDTLTYGVLRYLNTDVDLARIRTRRSGSTISGAWTAGRPGLAGDGWQISQDGASVTARRDGGADAAVAHRGAQRRHRGHRGRPAAARQLDVGALGAGSRAGQPAEPVVV